MGFDAQISSWVNGHMFFLYEQDPGPGSVSDELHVDEGTITLVLGEAREDTLQDTIFNNAACGNDCIQDYVGGFNMDIYNNTTLSFEWRHAQAYSEIRDTIHLSGNNYDDEDRLQLKMSVAF